MRTHFPLSRRKKSRKERKKACKNWNDLLKKTWIPLLHHQLERDSRAFKILYKGKDEKSN